MGMYQSVSITTENVDMGMYQSVSIASERVTWECISQCLLPLNGSHLNVSVSVYYL